MLTCGFSDRGRGWRPQDTVREKREKGVEVNELILYTAREDHDDYNDYDGYDLNATTATPHGTRI